MKSTMQHNETTRVKGKTIAFPQRKTLISLGAMVATALASLYGQPASAQTTIISPNTNLYTYSPSTGETWSLQGNAYVANPLSTSATKTLPTGTAVTAGLTINGNNNTLRLNDGAGHYAGFYSTTSMNTTLSDVTISGSGANNSAFFTSNGDLTLNTSGNTVFSGNTALSGGALFARQGSVIINGGATFTGNSATSGFGGAVYADKDIIFTDPTKLVTVNSNSAVQGGAGLNAINNITVAGSIVLDRNAAGTSNGGGVRSISGNVSLAGTTGNVTITGNTAGGNGGGLFAGAGNISIGNTAGTVTVGGSAANANSATNGGGIYSGAATTVNGSTVDISYNKTTSGNGGGINSTTTTTINGNTINLSNNTAGNNGGGIYAGGVAGGTAITINGNLTANNNVATNGSGGAIDAQNGNIQINGSLTANSNTAGFTNGGGAIAAINGSIAVTNGVRMDGNVATNGSGGALSALKGSVSLAQSGGDVTLTNNKSATGGGAVYASYATGSTFGNIVIGNSGSTISMTNNKAGDASHLTANGGALSAAGSITLTGSSITASNNTATQNGGALATGQAINIFGSLTANNNSAGGHGGAMQSGTGLLITGGLSASGNSAAAAGKVGGAIYVSTGDAIIHGDVNLTGNTAGNHGGAIDTFNGNIVLADVSGNVKLTSNTAGGNGGAIYANGTGVGNTTLGNSGSTITIGGTSTAGNTAVNGGGIYSNGTTTLNGSNIDLSFNKATTGSGGALYAVSTITLNGSSPTSTLNIAHNTANINGGALYSGKNIDLKGNYDSISIDSNKAISYGGALYAAQDLTVDTVTAGQLSITNNSVTGYFGGALFGNNSINLTGSYGSMLIDNNSSAQNRGGALATAVGRIDFTPTVTGDLTISNNRAVTRGGAIFSNTDLNFNSPLTGRLLITGNSAVQGGAFGVQNNIDLKGHYGSILIDGNNANDYGGAFIGQTMTIDTITDGSLVISNNHAGKRGGALYFYGGDVALKGSYDSITIGGASAAQGNSSVYGGAIWAAGGLSIDTATSGALTIQNNQSTGERGGALYADSGAVNISGSYGGILIDSNQAGGSGGAVYAGNGIRLNSTGNGTLAISNNTSAGKGGALLANSGNIDISGDYSNIDINGNQADNVGGAISRGTWGGDTASITINTQTTGALNIRNNTSTAVGAGAIYNTSGDLSINGRYGSILIDGNRAGYEGGALAIYGNVTIDPTVNGDVTLSNNVAGGHSGGAIYASGNVTLQPAAGGTLSINNNRATLNGGAIYANGAVSITPTAGAIDISGNTAAGAGGAVYAAGDVTLTVNGNTTISNNSADGKGGAIWAGSNITLNASNGDIAFRGNKHGDPVANAIWLDNTAGSTSATFNAVTGRSITFFDPIQNNAVNGLVSVVKSGDGLLSFDGSLYGNDTERWSQIYGNTDIQAGTFEVANHAIYGAQAADVSQTGTSSFSMGDNTVLQGGVMGTVRADAVSFGDNVIVSIAGRQPTARGVLEIVSPSLTLGANDRVLFNTYLNDGVVQNTDLLHLNRTAVSGDAKLYVSNVGGQGAMTVGNGIMLVNVTNGGTTSDSTFRLGGRVVAGIYEYDLYPGGVGADANDGNWYLRTLTLPPGNGGGSGNGNSTPAIAPEKGVYLRNLSAASGMFMHTLHDRLGEPQFTDSRKAEKDGKVSSAWVRVVGSHTDSNAANNQIDLDTDTSLVHFGGDLARWRNNDNNRWHLGLMGAFGQSDIDADPVQMKVTQRSQLRRAASGKVDGYSAGAYLTWFGNEDKPTGPYLDLWGQYAWYKNKVQGNGFKEESYNGTGGTVSIEGGYAFIARDGEKRQWMIEPQAQAAYNTYSADDHYERATNTRVHNGDSNGVITRLGARLYSRSKLGDNGIQPFIEANWWYSDAKNTLMFNNVELADGTPDSTYELKAGLQGEIAKGWQVWGHIGGRWGSNDYHSYEGMIGVKHQF